MAECDFGSCRACGVEIFALFTFKGANKPADILTKYVLRDFLDRHF